MRFKNAPPKWAELMEALRIGAVSQDILDEINRHVYRDDGRIPENCRMAIWGRHLPPKSRAGEIDDDGPGIEKCRRDFNVVQLSRITGEQVDLKMVHYDRDHPNTALDRDLEKRLSSRGGLLHFPPNNGASPAEVSVKVGARIRLTANHPVPIMKGYGLCTNNTGWVTKIVYSGDKTDTTKGLPIIFVKLAVWRGPQYPGEEQNVVPIIPRNWAGLKYQGKVYNRVCHHLDLAFAITHCGAQGASIDEAYHTHVESFKVNVGRALYVALTRAVNPSTDLTLSRPLTMDMFVDMPVLTMQWDRQTRLAAATPDLTEDEWDLLRNPMYD